MSISVPRGAARTLRTKSGSASKPGNLAPQPMLRARSLPVPSGQGTRQGVKDAAAPLPSERSARTVEATQLKVPSPPKHTSSAPCAAAGSASSASRPALRGRHSFRVRQLWHPHCRRVERAAPRERWRQGSNTRCKSVAAGAMARGGRVGRGGGDVEKKRLRAF